MSRIRAAGEALFAHYGPSDPVSAERGWFVRLLGGKTNAGVDVTEYTAMRLPVVFACVNRIANPLSSFPVKIYQTSAAGGAEVVTQHPMSERLGLRPNDLMSSRTLRKSIQGHGLLWGNGYVEIERNRRGEAVGLWPMLPNVTKPERKDDRLRYRTTIDGQQYLIDQENVLHIMDISHDGYVGVSQIAMAREALGMAAAMEKFGGSFFRNEAKSGGFLLHPGKLSAGAHKNLRGGNGEEGPSRSNPASRLAEQGGIDNAHRVKVLEEGMKFVSTTIPPEDAQFLGSREFQIAEIARIYDVPLILLQSHEKSTSWGTGIEQLMIGFVRQTVKPWVDAWEQELNWKLFTEAERARGLYVKFNMNAILRGDMQARAAFYREMFAVGAINPNQIAALEDIEPIGPLGDNHFVPANFVTLQQAADGGRNGETVQ